MVIEQAGPGDGTAVAELAEILVDCVDGGASLGFLAGLTHEQAEDFWRGALAGDGLTWVARDDGGRAVGTVRLLLAPQPNGAHRGEVAKLMVRGDARGHGWAGALLGTLEEAARELGRTVLVLDTETGSPAEGFYARRGWQRVGVIEDYAARTDGQLAATTVMSKRLTP